MSFILSRALTLSTSLSFCDVSISIPFACLHVGGALSEVGVALKQMSCFREGLDICVKQNFIDPLHCLHDNELREIGVSV